MRSLLAAIMIVIMGLIATATAATLLENAARTRATPPDVPAPPTAGVERYIGEYRGGKYNGHGTLIYANGEKYVGKFRDNLRDGQGTYSWPDGRRYVGEFRDGQPNGQGRYTQANGEEYVGGFRNNRRESHGVYSWPDHRRYEGDFHDDLPNGRGVLTLAGGQKLTGLFQNGEYVGEETVPSFAAVASIGEGSANVMQIHLRRRGVNFTAPALLNGVTECEFYIDSGAADVLVPMHVFDALLRAGTISRDDVTGMENYRMANGSSMKSVTFRIKTLKIGSITLENVRGSVGSQSGPALLGMSFLNRFKSWRLDNERHVLTLE